MAWIEGMKYFSIALVFFAVFIVFSRPGTKKNAGKMGWWRKVFKRLGRFSPASTAATAKQQGRLKNKRYQTLGTLAGALVGVLLAGGDMYDPVTYLAALILAGAGYLSPGWAGIVLEAQRKKALDQQLPDALELIANSLRAGLSLVQALEVVAKEAPLPIRDVFREVHRDCRLGLSPEDALEKLLKRWKNKDLELFAVAAGVSLRTGGNLAEVIGRIVGTVRERFRLKGRIASLTAQGKLSGWVVGLLPFFLLIALSLMDPDLMSCFFHHPLGIAMLAGGLIMELIGAFFITKITRIDT
ncbi:type II secretion system F family protein [bacterium]|nr:type II secretion system F family protein [bacterium]